MAADGGGDDAASLDAIAQYFRLDLARCVQLGRYDVFYALDARVPLHALEAARGEDVLTRLLAADYPLAAGALAGGQLRTALRGWQAAAAAGAAADQDANGGGDDDDDGDYGITMEADAAAPPTYYARFPTPTAATRAQWAARAAALLAPSATVVALRAGFDAAANRWHLDDDRGWRWAFQRCGARQFMWPLGAGVEQAAQEALDAATLALARGGRGSALLACAAVPARGAANVLLTLQLSAAGVGVLVRLPPPAAQHGTTG